MEIRSVFLLVEVEEDESGSENDDDLENEGDDEEEDDFGPVLVKNEVNTHTPAPRQTNTLLQTETCIMCARSS
jgi:hypothetical protein